MPFLAQEHYPIPHSDINSWLFDTPRYDWDEPIYIDGTRPKDNFIAARKAKATIRRLVAGLRRLGLQQGDAVDLHSFNHIYYPILFLGVIAAGGVFVGTNPAYTPYELKHAFKIAKVKWVFCAPDLLAPVEKAMSELSLSKDCLVLFNPDGNGATPGYKQWSDLLVHGEQDWIRFNDLRKSKETEASRMFSSGTTGLPKAASVSHHNLIAQHVLVFEANPRPWRACRLLSLPMFHAATAPAAYCTPLREGSKAYVFPRFDLEQWFRCSEEYGVTDLVAVPPVVVAAINSPLRHKYSLKSVRDCKAGAAPLDAKAQARLQALLGDAPFTQVWGMTETTCIATRFKWSNTDTTGSVGYPIPNIDLKLVDDDGKDISRDDIRGELCIRGPTVVPGYYENEEANKRDWDQEGFFHTGDIAYRDGRTKLWYIVDRKKELIKVRGFQVTPPELEGQLLDHPDIVDAAVIGVPDPSRESELPRAYIVRRPGDGQRLTAQQVHKHMRERLASYKQLEGGVVFVDAIPKNASGKILKRILREQAKTEMASKL